MNNENTADQAAVEVQNIVAVEDAGPCKKKVAVEIPESAVHAALGEQYKELRKDAQVPGFRKGRAPIKLLEKRFGKDVIEQVKLKLLANASQKAMDDNNLKPLTDPQIDHEKIEMPDQGSLKFEFEVEVRPEFDLPETEGIEITTPAFQITDEQVDEELNQLRKRSGIWAPIDGAVEKDDQVIADVSVSAEGDAEPTKHDNAEIYVRSTSMVGPVIVEKLDELLVGAAAGDVRKTSVDVPKTFYNETWRGKKVDVEITVRDIKRLKPAELDPAFFERYGVADEADLRSRINELLQSRAEQTVQTNMRDQVYKYLLEKTTFELPESIVADQASQLLRRRYTDLLMRGMTAEQVQEQFDSLKAATDEQAVEQLRIFFIMDKLAAKFGIEVTEEEVNSRVAQLAVQQGRRPEKMREEMVRDGSLTSFGLQVREEKCLEKLLESAKIVEAKEPGKKKSPKKGSEKADK